MASDSDKGVQFKEEGNKLMTQKKWDAAIDAYTKAIDCDPSNHIFYSNRCAAYSRKGDLEKALADAEKCAEIAPEWPKSYVRLSHSLNDLKRYEEAIQACETGLKYETNNTGLKAQLKEAKNQLLLSKLKGKWHGTVPPELGGYDQELDFVDARTVVVKVFEKQVETRMRLNAEEDPAHMDLFVPDAGTETEIYYIAKIDENDVLHMCSPSFENPSARPTKFEGPAHVSLKRGPKPVDVDDATKAKVAGMSEEEKVISYIEEALKIFPGKRLLPYQTDSEQQKNEITLLNIRFQSDNYKITAKYGVDIETLIREYLLGEKTPASTAVIESVDKLKLKMQEACLLPPDDQLDSFRKQQKEMQNEEASAAAQAALQNSEVKMEKSQPPIEKAKESTALKPSSKREQPASAAFRSDPFPMLAGIALVIGGIAIAAILLSKKK